MVTLRAIHPHPQEDLADKGTHVRRITFVPEYRHRSMLMRAAFCRQELAHQLVIGQVLAESIAQPVVQQIDRLHPDARGIWANQITPFHGPMICVVGVFEEVVHQPLTFVGTPIRKERATHFHGWQHPDQIQRGTAQELLIRAGATGQQAELAMPFMYPFVDLIVLRQLRISGIGQLCL